jgi:hypothetical protein
MIDTLLEAGPADDAVATAYRAFHHPMAGPSDQRWPADGGSIRAECKLDRMASGGP